MMCCKEVEITQVKNRRKGREKEESRKNSLISQ